LLQAWAYVSRAGAAKEAFIALAWQISERMVIIVDEDF
jgi:hypothetical protein